MPLEHLALFYAGDDVYAKRVGGFVRDGVEAGRPVLAAVPERRIALLRDTVGAVPTARFVNMAELGRNPARIIPAIEAFLDEHPGPVRFVGEPIWPGRSPAETVEATRHEALINHAFADRDAVILCPYDLDGLPGSVLADAELTHPVLCRDGRREESLRFADPIEMWEAADRPLPQPAGPVTPLELRDLAALRRSIRTYLTPGADGTSVEDFLLAVSEAATNTLRHGGGGGGAARMWHDRGGVVCEFRNAGRIDDPLAGRVRPGCASDRGRGLWLINHLCDLAELRTDAGDTVLRLHRPV
jgi:anti-sigma regulatory factor (Ser/Thr protein kinase)